MRGFQDFCLWAGSGSSPTNGARTRCAIGARSSATFRSSHSPRRSLRSAEILAISQNATPHGAPQTATEAAAAERRFTLLHRPSGPADVPPLSGPSHAWVARRGGDGAREARPRAMMNARRDGDDWGIVPRRGRRVLHGVGAARQSSGSVPEAITLARRAATSSASSVRPAPRCCSRNLTWPASAVDGWGRPGALLPSLMQSSGRACP